MLNDELLEYFVLLGGPFRLVAAEFLDEEPPFMAFPCVLGRDDFGNLFPIIVVEIFNEFGVLYHEGEEAVLEQVSLVIFPLGQRSETLRRIFLLFEQLVEYFHGLFVRNDPLAVELVLPVLEPDHILEVAARVRALTFAAFASSLLVLE